MSLFFYKTEKKKDIYYQAPNGKVFTPEKYEEVKIKPSERR